MDRAGGWQLHQPRRDQCANTFIKWNHHIGRVVNALAAGLRIEFLHEYDFTHAPFHGLERGEDGLWRIPADRFQIPLTFSLRAAKDPVGGG